MQPPSLRPDIPDVPARLRLRLASCLIDLVYLLLLVILVPWLAYLILIRRRGMGSLRQRLGDIPLGPPKKPRVWIHAVSVGELEAALPLLGAIERHAGGVEVVVSTTTTSAQKLARSRCPDLPVFLFPLDLGFCVRRALRRVQPSIIVLLELELWPNLLLCARSRGVPVMVVNGRITERSRRRMGHARPLFRPLLNDVTLYLLQNDEYRSRLSSLGVDEKRMRIAGNLKFDRPPIADPSELRRRFEKRRGYAPGALRWIAGCTHAGEEALLFDVHRELRKRFPDLGLILAPRHIERASQVLRQAEEAGFRVRLYSAHLGGGSGPPPDIEIVDVTGELADLYACADVAFVGGSLVPRGGHNLIEPFAAGTPALHGPFTSNFTEVVGLLTGGGASVEVRDAGELGEQLAKLLADPALRRERAERGRELLARHRGVAERSTEELLRLLP